MSGEYFNKEFVTLLDGPHYPDGVFRVRFRGDQFDRVQLHVDGSVFAGDGQTPPVQISSGGGASEAINVSLAAVPGLSAINVQAGIAELAIDAEEALFEALAARSDAFFAQSAADAAQSDADQAALDASIAVGEALAAQADAAFVTSALLDEHIPNQNPSNPTAHKSTGVFVDASGFSIITSDHVQGALQQIDDFLAAL